MAAMTTLGIITAIASTAAGVYGSIQSASAQQQQAEYQSDMAAYNSQVAEINAQNAEYEGKEAKKTAYEESLEKRQQAALMVGQQRAAQGASGASVDVGSALDLNLDTVEKGAIDAFNIQEQGYWQDYNKRVEAWNYRNQAAGLQAQSSMYSNQASAYSPLLSATPSLLSGVSKLGGSFSLIK